jgi:hypothetical protein
MQPAFRSRANHQAKPAVRVDSPPNAGNICWTYWSRSVYPRAATITAVVITTD